jgi:hypothetical protein
MKPDTFTINEFQTLGKRFGSGGRSETILNETLAGWRLWFSISSAHTCYGFLI